MADAKYPKVADLVKMGGNKRRDPSALVLEFPAWTLLHRIIMAAPPAGEGYEAKEGDAQHLPVLRDNKLIQQATASTRWWPTGAGIQHMHPTRKPNRAALRMADAVLEKLNEQVMENLSKIKKH